MRFPSVSRTVHLVSSHDLRCCRLSDKLVFHNRISKARRLQESVDRVISLVPVRGFEGGRRVSCPLLAPMPWR